MSSKHSAASPKSSITSTYFLIHHSEVNKKILPTYNNKTIISCFAVTLSTPKLHALFSFPILTTVQWTASILSMMCVCVQCINFARSIFSTIALSLADYSRRPEQDVSSFFILTVVCFYSMVRMCYKHTWGLLYIERFVTVGKEVF